MIGAVVLAAKHQENLLIERIEEIRHHIRIESAIEEGSQNMLKHLRPLKSVNRKALQEVVYSLGTICSDSDPRDIYSKIVSRLIFLGFSNIPLRLIYVLPQTK